VGRLRFFLVEALRSIRSNVGLSMAATVTVLITVFVLGAFIPSFLYVQSAVDAQKAKVDVTIYLHDPISGKEINRFQQRLQGDTQIKSFSFISKNDAQQILKQRLNDPHLMDQLPSNPLPSSFVVTPKDPNQSQAIVSRYQNDPAVDGPVGFDRNTTNKLLSVATFIQWSGLVLIVILLTASLLLIGNTIRLSIFARRREVEVMKLVGATNWFIRWPFVIEGVVCGVIGGIASVVLLWAVKVSVVDNWLNTSDQGLTRDTATTIGFTSLALILIAAGALVGALGSGLTLRRFLRV
jgi:cell division transport system permease protein